MHMESIGGRQIYGGCRKAGAPDGNKYIPIMGWAIKSDIILLHFEKLLEESRLLEHSDIFLKQIVPTAV